VTVDELEHAIRTLLLDFEEESGREIESVRVDTRNFANLHVEVFLKGAGDEKRSG
jgi:hypothetical protein